MEIIQNVLTIVLLCLFYLQFEENNDFYLIAEETEFESFSITAQNHNVGYSFPGKDVICILTFIF